MNYGVEGERRVPDRRSHGYWTSCATSSVGERNQGEWGALKTISDDPKAWNCHGYWAGCATSSVGERSQGEWGALKRSLMIPRRGIVMGIGLTVRQSLLEEGSLVSVEY